jgi:DNA-nicking Smr family endonuclease
MGRRKKRTKPVPAAPEALPPSAPFHRPFESALRDVAAPPAPKPGEPSPHTLPPPGPAPAEPVPSGPPPPAAEPPDRARMRRAYEDRVVFAQAFADVQPLRSRRAGAGRPGRSASAKPTKAPGPVVDPDAERRARARLDALVGGGARIRVEREEGWVQGVREGAPRGVVDALLGPAVVPEGELDLHGLRSEEVERAVVRFLRDAHRRGLRRVLLVHGRGAHSDGGVAVLGDRVVEVLHRGGAAPLVLAFVTAPRRLGGEGALLVQLASR